MASAEPAGPCGPVPRCRPPGRVSFSLRGYAPAATAVKGPRTAGRQSRRFRTPGRGGRMGARASVAQLDRASVFGTEGCRFESCRAYWSWRSIGGARPGGIATPGGQPAGSSPAGRIGVGVPLAERGPEGSRRREVSLQVRVLPGVLELAFHWRSEARRDRDAGELVPKASRSEAFRMLSGSRGVRYWQSTAPCSGRCRSRFRRRGFRRKTLSWANVAAYLPAPQCPRLRWGIILQINCLTIRGPSPFALEVSMLHRIAPQAVSGSGTLSSGPDDYMEP
jgi:hypothetical protein